jgi:hypothetical protein
MNNKSERRDFNRFLVDLMIEVGFEDRQGNKCSENTVLRDISGGGACFITQQSHNYFPGQLLELAVLLPETDDVKAQMTAKATVVRKEPLTKSFSGKESREMSIAVKLDAPLRFERVDVETRGDREKGPGNLLQHQ